MVVLSLLTQHSMNADAAISQQAATDIVLGVFPNTSIISIELDEKFGGTQVQEVHTGHGIELNIDAQNSSILTIERGDNANTNGNLNTNSNDNANNNTNEKDNDNGNTNSNDNDDDDDDNSGSGSGDD